ncbi:MAG: NADH:ubiquinone reductase (Na(+)-transporting) subunit F [Fibrobacterota bacterium]
MEIILSIIIFTAVIILLVALLNFAESRLVNTGTCKIIINDDEEKTLDVDSGRNLLNTLADNKIFLPSACGGGGTCGMCKCTIEEGGGDVLPTEMTHLSRVEVKKNVRVSCQVKVKNDLRIRIPDEIFNIKKYKTTVVSNKNVATFIKELVLKLEPNETLDFKAGGYVQLDIPPYSCGFRDFDIEDEYKEDWEKMGLLDIEAFSDEPVFRAYSMANYPAENDIIMLTVRIAAPPRGSDHPPGVASSYIFNLKKGDEVTVSGPYGEFFAKETNREMCFIGGGAGMAPMRSHIFHQLKTLETKRKITYWYGARSRKEMFYDEEFQKLESEFDNFKYTVALSDPLPGDDWDGPVGFIHDAAFKLYLDKHPDPSEVEYYLCGPPMMIKAVTGMLDSIGVDPEMISFDEF